MAEFQGQAFSERKTGRERELDRSYIAFSDLVLEVIQHYFCILLIKVVSKSHPNSRKEEETIPLNGEWQGSGKSIWTTELMWSFLENTVCCRRERKRGCWEISELPVVQEGDDGGGGGGSGKKRIHVRDRPEGWTESSDWKDVDGKEDGMLEKTPIFQT